MADRKRKPQRRATVPTTPAAGQTAEDAQAEEELNEAEKKLLAQLRARRAVRPQAPRVKVRHEPPGPMTLAATDGRELGHLLALLSTFGTASIDFQVRTLHELIEASCRGGNHTAFAEWDVNGALAALHGIAPRDEAEALLAAQMVAVHSAAMRCLRQLKGSENIPQQDSNGSLAVKLLRTFTAQMEALQRYRGKGEQKMTVEHVHVHAGGQAIVGEVKAGSLGEGVPGKPEERAHAKAIAHAPEPPMPSPDPQRDAVSVARGPRQA